MDEMNIRTILQAFTTELRTQRDFHKEMFAVQKRAVESATKLMKALDQMEEIREEAKK